MIISTREEEMVADCQGLIADLVIFSSMFSGLEREWVCLRAYGKIWEEKERLDWQITV